MADTRHVWEPLYGHDLSDSDVIEILTNVHRLLDVLRPGTFAPQPGEKL